MIGNWNSTASHVEKFSLVEEHFVSNSTLFKEYHGYLSTIHAPVEMIAVLFLWLKQLRSVTLFSHTMATLTLMIGGMVRDVISFLLLLLTCLAAFAAGLSKLYINGADDTTDADCEDTMIMLSYFPTATFKLFEGTLLGEGYLDCVHNSIHPVSGVFLMYGFVIISVLLLLNMISALWQQLKPHSQSTGLPD